MKKYILAYPVAFSLAIFFGIFSQFMSTATVFFSMYVIDAIAYGDLSDLTRFSIIGIGMIVAFFLSSWAYGRIASYYIYKTQMKMKIDLFQSILGKSISEFGQDNSAKYISLINNDIQMIGDSYIGNILEMVKFIFIAIFSFVAIAVLSPLNAVIALILSSFPLLIPFIFGNKMATINMEYMNRLGKLNEKVKDFLSGFEVIKTFAIEKQISNISSVSIQEAEHARYEVGKFNVSVLLPLTVTFFIGTQLITYLVAGYFVITGSLTVGAVVAIAGLTGNIGQPIHMISSHIAGIKSTKKVRENLLAISEIADLEKKSDLVDFSQGITLHDLRFQYPKKEVAIPPKKKKKFSMTIVPNDGNLEDNLRKAGIDPNEVTMLNMDSDVSSQMSMSDIQSILEETLEEVSGEKQSEFHVLNGITFDFKPSGKYAVVGPSGSGKSTLAKILLGYYDGYEGQARIGDTEIRDINREHLYQGISTIHQSVFMLDDTFRNNITLYGDYSEAAYLEALEKSRLVDLVDSLPDGSDTLIGEGGNTLSGGERQRIAIARALIKKSQIVIMDEATSNLDNETAYEIENTLMETPSQLVVFVTHRYSQEILEKCDGILVLKEGELIESGTFGSLIDSKGYFYSLYTINQRGEVHV